MERVGGNGRWSTRAWAESEELNTRRVFEPDGNRRMNGSWREDVKEQMHTFVLRTTTAASNQRYRRITRYASICSFVQHYS